MTIGCANWPIEGSSGGAVEGLQDRHVGKQVALAKRMDIEDCARLYALSAIAGADAFIAVFEAKYTYNL